MPLPATNLVEASKRLSLEPLEGETGDYVDLAAARGSSCLGKLKNRLLEHLESTDLSCHLAFVGHRGSGKSTELIRLEHQLKESCFPVHLELDGTLHEDADYPDLFLWLVESITSELRAKEVPFDDKHAETVGQWYAEITQHDNESVKKSVGIETTAEASAGFQFLGLGAKLLASLKSSWIGAKETRTEMRKQVKHRTAELIQLVNTFLLAASDALKAKNLPHRLLVVQDNLDRLRRDAAVALFSDGADIIQQLNAAFVWTAPVGTLLAPFNLSNKFDCFLMPMISVRRKNGNPNAPAFAGLEALLARRMDPTLTFDSPELVRDLIEGCGGSVRELIRLTNAARLEARTEGHSVIEAADIERARKDNAINLQNALTPTNIFFPILAQIAEDKEYKADIRADKTLSSFEDRREFFHTLVAEGAVYAYNGEGLWFDVNPNLHLLDSFAKVLAPPLPAVP